MADIALFPVGDGDEFDAVMLAGDFIVDNSIRTASYVSLLSDAEDLNATDGDPHGWWGDALSTIPGDSTGSLLWTLSRAKQIDATLNSAISFDQSALQWMLDDGVASAVNVSGSWVGIGGMSLVSNIVAPTGPQKIKLAYLWQQSIIAPTGAVAPGELLVSFVPTEDGFSAILSWSPTAGAVSYAVYVATTPGTEAGSPTVSTAALNATIPGLNGGTTYFFLVMALDASGDVIAISAELSADAITQPAPLSLTVVACDGHLRLNWAGVSGATYNVYLGTSAGEENPTPIATGVDVTTYEVDGLTNGLTYYAYIRSVVGDLVSPPSNEVFAQPTTLVPPTGVGITPNNGQVTLTWNPVAGATFNIYQGTSPGGEGGSPVATGITGTSTTISGLTNCTTYYFKVASVNLCGQTSMSAEVSANVQAPLGAPIVTATPGVDQITLNWTAGANASSYSVFMGTSSGGESPTPIASGLTSLSTIVPGLDYHDTYYFTVAAVNPCGTMRQSAEISAAPVAPGFLATVLGDSPFAVFSLGETSGTTAVDMIGAQNGTYEGGYTLGQASLLPSVTSKSVLLNGSNGFIQLPSISAFKGLNRNYSIEAAFVMEAPAVLGGGVIFSAGNSGVLLYVDDSGILHFSQGAVADYVSGATALSLGVDYLILASVDSSGNVDIYVNGSLYASGSVSGITFNGITSPSIGAQQNPAGPSNYFDGGLQYVNLYNSALNSSQATDHFEAAFGL